MEYVVSWAEGRGVGRRPLRSRPPRADDSFLELPNSGANDAAFCVGDAVATVATATHCPAAAASLLRSLRVATTTEPGTRRPCSGPPPGSGPSGSGPPGSGPTTTWRVTQEKLQSKEYIISEEQRAIEKRRKRQKRILKQKNNKIQKYTQMRK